MPSPAHRGLPLFTNRRAEHIHDQEDRAMPTGIVIPELVSEPMFRLHFNSLTDYQAVIGGNIEAVDLTTPAPATMYVDEEGLLKRREFNARATMILMVHNPAYLFAGANIVGPAIIVGEPDEEGETLNVPEAYELLLLHTGTYRIEVQTADNAEAWNGNQRRFNEVSEAYESAVNLAHRWMAVEQVRVVAA